MIGQDIMTSGKMKGRGCYNSSGEEVVLRATQVTTQGEGDREQDEIAWVFQASSRLEILMILEAQK